jgi:cytochrome c peroxidase
VALALGASPPGSRAAATWSEADVDLLRSLSLESLAPLAPDPSNAVADHPQAAEFGRELFFDRRLSGNGAISCAHCHDPGRRFTDGLPKGVAIGTAKRNTLSIVGTAYSPWFYWDGRRDSQWSQALSPLEDANEHGTNRLQVVRVVAADPDYRRRYEELFGALPDLADRNRFPDNGGPVADAAWAAAWQNMAAEDRHSVNRAYANVGKAIAAYERRLLPGPSRFDAYVAAVAAGKEEQQAEIFSADEVEGLRLFIGRGNCTQCHNGPLLTNHEFHNTGVISFPGEMPDKGRAVGVRDVLSNEFNCLGPYSDDVDRRCDELEFARTGPDLVGTMRTPSLRNLAATDPYMHKGQLKTLADVLRHYNEAPAAMIGHSELKPLGLSRRELQQLEAFLNTFDAPLATPAPWLQPPAATP